MFKSDHRFSRVFSKSDKDLKVLLATKGHSGSYRAGGLKLKNPASAVATYVGTKKNKAQRLIMLCRWHAGRQTGIWADADELATKIFSIVEQLHDAKAWDTKPDELSEDMKICRTDAELLMAALHRLVDAFSRE